MYRDFRDRTTVFGGVIATVSRAADARWQRTVGARLAANSSPATTSSARRAPRNRARRSRRRRPHARCASAGRPQPRLLAAPLRRRSVCAEPDADAQRPSDDDRRRLRAPGSTASRSASARRDGAGDDEGADDADLGRPRQPAQPLADRHGAAEAGRHARAGRSGDERRLPPDQRAGGQGHSQRIADVPRSASSSKHLVPAAGGQRATPICAGSSRRRSSC